MDNKPVSPDLYNKDYYIKYNHGYDSYTKAKEPMPEIAAFLQDLDFKNKRVLDIGCGRGEVVRYCVTRGAEAYGIDYSPSAIEIAGKILEDLSPMSYERGHFIKMDAKKLEFDDNIFDYVIMLDIVEHLYDWELRQCLNEVNRVLSPEGLVLIHTSPNRNLMNVIRFLAGIFGIALKSSEFHVNEQTPKSLSTTMSSWFSGNLILSKDRKYWSHQMDYRGKPLKVLAAVADSFSDNAIIDNLCKIGILSNIFTTDIWYKGRKKPGI